MKTSAFDELCKEPLPALLVKKYARHWKPNGDGTPLFLEIIEEITSQMNTALRTLERLEMELYGASLRGSNDATDIRTTFVALRGLTSDLGAAADFTRHSCHRDPVVLDRISSKKGAEQAPAPKVLTRALNSGKTPPKTTIRGKHAG